MSDAAFDDLDDGAADDATEVATFVEEPVEDDTYLEVLPTGPDGDCEDDQTMVFGTDPAETVCVEERKEPPCDDDEVINLEGDASGIDVWCSDPQ